MGRNWAHNGPYNGRANGVWRGLPHGSPLSFFKKKKKKKRPRFWAKFGANLGPKWPKNGFLGVPRGAPSKFKPKKQKKRKRVGDGLATPERATWQMGAQVWLLPLPFCPGGLPPVCSFHGDSGYLGRRREARGVHRHSFRHGLSIHGVGSSGLWPEGI